MRRRHRAIQASRHRAIALGCVALCAALAGCRGERSDNPPRQFFPDMDDQPKSKAQSASGFFPDGRSMREPVRGAVAFGAKPFAEAVAGVDFSRRGEYLKVDERLFTGAEPVLDADDKAVLDETGQPRVVYLERTPIEAVLGVRKSDPDFSTRYEELLALGEKKFNIYCIVCHGGTGDGRGTVGVRWSYPLPTFHDPKYYPGGEKGQDGYIFHTIRHGVPNLGENVPYPLKMPSYAGKISEKEAWAIVEHFRVLQRAASSPIDAVPERDRMDLEKRKPVAQQQQADTGKEVGS